MRLSKFAPDFFELCDLAASRADARSRSIQHPIHSPLDGQILSVELAPEGSMARKVIKRSNIKPTGAVASSRNINAIESESAHETNFARIFELHASAGHLRAQPAVIHYIQDGVERIHYPDFLQDSKHRVFWEIKTLKDIRRPDIHARTALMQRDLPKFGFHYRVALDVDLMREPRLHTVLEIRHLARRVRRIDADALCDSLSVWKQFRWGDICSGSHSDLSAAVACHLVSLGRLHVDIDARLTNDSVLTLVKAS